MAKTFAFNATINQIEIDENQDVKGNICYTYISKYPHTMTLVNVLYPNILENFS